MPSRQRGMTFLGILVLIAVIGTWVYAGIRLTPLYLNYMKVSSTLEKVRDELESNPDTTEFMVRKAIERHFDIEMVNEAVFNDRDAVIRKDGPVFHVTAAYEDTAHFVYNIYFLVSFEKTVDIQAR